MPISTFDCFEIVFNLDLERDIGEVFRLLENNSNL